MKSQLLAAADGERRLADHRPRGSASSARSTARRQHQPPRTRLSISSGRPPLSPRTAWPVRMRWYGSPSWPTPSGWRSRRLGCRRTPTSTCSSTRCRTPRSGCPGTRVTWTPTRRAVRASRSSGASASRRSRSRPAPRPAPVVHPGDASSNPANGSAAPVPRGAVVQLARRRGGRRLPQHGDALQRRSHRRGPGDEHPELPERRGSAPVRDLTPRDNRRPGPS